LVLRLPYFSIYYLKCNKDTVTSSLNIICQRMSELSIKRKQNKKKSNEHCQQHYLGDIICSLSIYDINLWLIKSSVLIDSIILSSLQMQYIVFTRRRLTTISTNRSREFPKILFYSTDLQWSVRQYFSNSIKIDFSMNKIALEMISIEMSAKTSFTFFTTQI